MCKKPMNDTVQLHVEISRSQHQQLKAVLKKLGYATVSELVREHIRRIVLAAQEEETLNIIRSRRTETETATTRTPGA